MVEQDWLEHNLNWIDENEKTNDYCKSFFAWIKNPILVAEDAIFSHESINWSVSFEKKSFPNELKRRNKSFHEDCVKDNQENRWSENVLMYRSSESQIHWELNFSSGWFKFRNYKTEQNSSSDSKRNSKNSAGLSHTMTPSGCTDKTKNITFQVRLWVFRVQEIWLVAIIASCLLQLGQVLKIFPRNLWRFDFRILLSHHRDSDVSSWLVWFSHGRISCDHFARKDNALARREFRSNVKISS